MCVHAFAGLETASHMMCLLASTALQWPSWNRRLLLPRLVQRLPELLQEASKSKIGMVLQLDVSMDAPVITMPRNSDSKDAVEVDLGSLRLHNSVAWRKGSSADDPQVCHHVNHNSLFAPPRICNAVSGG